MTSSPPKECTICRKPLKSRSSRHYHEHCQNPELKPFKCDHCDRTFSTKAHKTFHEETHSNRRLQCTQCDKTYQHQRDLDLHNREHRAPKSLQAKCNRCAEQFESQQALAQHKRTQHASTKRFKCDQCDMTFGLKGNLTKHAKIIHSKEKLFKCDQCGKAFYRNNALKFHMLNHRSRDFQCKTCQKEFVDARNLERHLKTHATDKEFRCDICGISSSRKDNILRHAKSFHPECDVSKVVLKSEITDQLDAIKKDAKQSNKSTPIKTDAAPPAEPPISNRISVIKVVGKPKPLHRPEPTESVPADGPPKTEIQPKPPAPKMNPLEIYRKILKPSNDDDDNQEEGNRVDNNKLPSSNAQVKTTNSSSTQASADNTSIANSGGSNNSSINNFTEVHWRKRTSQIYATNSNR
ncbi:zinc finger protein OZF [Aedes aegypti]|uniref:C2H2-type domain-containing protein n=1 Tax=Aedes aegypti TaxID=7159 RepID=A0A6I8TIV4_AEDAE|nr:zinc finger protein OZF [Aedes aegypti]